MRGFFRWGPTGIVAACSLAWPAPARAQRNTVAFSDQAPFLSFTRSEMVCVPLERFERENSLK